MKDTNNGGPAFPFPSDAGAGEPGELGMSLRDYFAAKAMQGLLAGNSQRLPGYVPRFAKEAYILADAMLKARQQ